MNLLTEIQYFPVINLYKILNGFSNVTFEQYETYQKSGLRNRCRVASAQGMVELSVPLVKGRDQKTLVRDVRISNHRPWAAQHWKTLESCYSRSPWFDYYRAELEALYHHRKWDWLLDWDLACFEWSLKALDFSVEVGLTDGWRKVYDPGKVADWRGMSRHGGPWEKGLLDPRDVREGGGVGPENRREDQGTGLMERRERGGAGPDNRLEAGGAGPLESREEEGPGLGSRRVKEGMGQRYRQVFEERTGFIPNLSILDLLFCEGKKAIRYIRSS